MQKGSFTPNTPRFDTEGVVNRMNELSDLFRKSELPVIYIQHDGSGTGELMRPQLSRQFLSVSYLF